MAVGFDNQDAAQVVIAARYISVCFRDIPDLMRISAVVLTLGCKSPNNRPVIDYEDVLVGLGSGQRDFDEDREATFGR